jgi:hypothetical protein
LKPFLTRNLSKEAFGVRSFYLISFHLSARRRSISQNPPKFEGTCHHVMMPIFSETLPPVAVPLKQKNGIGCHFTSGKKTSLLRHPGYLGRMRWLASKTAKEQTYVFHQGNFLTSVSHKPLLDRIR